MSVAVFSYRPSSEASARISTKNDVISPPFGPAALKYFMTMAFCAGETPAWSRMYSTTASPFPSNRFLTLSVLVPLPEGTSPNPTYTTRFSHTPMVGVAAPRTLLANSSCVMPSAADLSTLSNRLVMTKEAYCWLCASPALVVA